MKDDMRREYRFDYRRARPNRFAPLMKRKTVAIVLDQTSLLYSVPPNPSIRCYDQ
jgi:hypothetical protein